MRAALARRIPTLRPVLAVTSLDVAAAGKNPRIHSMLIMADASGGLLWGHTAFITISARAAATLRDAQAAGTQAPLWALLLGAALETRWALPLVSYPGHLQDALLADAARQIQGLMLTAPALAARVLSA